MKIIGLRTIKTAFGAALAIFIAEFLGLKYASAAGIITILSIQNTKKTSLVIAFQRMASTVLALFISCVLFEILGYNPIVFGLYLIVFIPLAVRFRLTEGIVVSSVLVTHILVEKSVSVFWIKNELLLMIVGAGIAIILNSYMPKINKKIKENQKLIEEDMRKILFNMASNLRNKSTDIKENEFFLSLEASIKKGSDMAYRNLNNYIINEDKYYVMYMEMRTIQFQILKYMRNHFTRFYMTYEQTEMVAKLTDKIALQLEEENPVDTLTSELKRLYDELKKQKLPETREEFENRAMLFQFLNDLEYFLEVKRKFILNRKENNMY
ncbi:aromatic acid exporter family protein [Clostridium hydrogenum]|uniref:aromatic acid exporter family protein n=1 Tax=Clostridium hydrogenum TaxID=2855764 RepID=UPI001F2DAAD4|nr:aromatic acid exporter family protein [Clostridium hydrogenum]